MKNKFKTSFSIFMLILFTQACQKEDASYLNQSNGSAQGESLNNKTSPNLKSATSLSDDPVFSLYFSNSYYFIDNVVDVNFADSILLLNSHTANDLNLLANSLGYSNYNDLSDFYQEQDSLLNILESNYNITSLNDQDLINTFEVQIKDYGFTESPLPEADPCKCRSTGLSCVAAVAATAGLAHIGCMVLDLAVVPGIICHSLVVTVQIFEQNKCEDDAYRCALNYKE